MIYEKIALGIGVCVLVASVFGDSRSSWNTEAKEAISHTFGNDKTIDVDNVNGTIRVIGDSTGGIRVEGEKIIRALNQQEVDRARREVTLDMNEKDGVAQLYVNGPFRDRGYRDRNTTSDNHGFHEHNDRQYEVTYNLIVHVPHETALQLRNVNGGTTAERTRGSFDLHSVNGPVTMTSVAGSGNVKTVNGAVLISFTENPSAACDFETVNGSIEASFQPNLSADLRLKTMNGDAYTDFDVTALASPAGASDRKNGKFVYRSNRATSVRVGAGGPQLSFQTLNGGIRIKKGPTQ